MSDHVHGIIRIHDNPSVSGNPSVNHNRSVSGNPSVETRHVASLQNNAYTQNDGYIQNDGYAHRAYNKFGGLPKQSLPSIIQAYKSTVTRWCHQHHYHFQWQPRYYEKIIRSQRELLFVQQYIINNPKKMI